MSARLRAVLPVVAGLTLFFAALLLLRVELRALSWRTLAADVVGTPLPRLGLATLLVALNYTALTGYDLLAFAYVGRRIPRIRIAMVSFAAYAVANNIGLAVLSGASIRYRFYTRWGVTREELARIIVSYSTTFWLGLLALGGLSLIVSPVPDSVPIGRPWLVTSGWLLMLMPASYVVASALTRRPLRFRSFELPLPPPRIALAQALLSALDWVLAGSVLYVLLPTAALPFLTFIGLFLAAALLSLASHVPGGLGVFEGLMVLLLRPFVDSATLVPALVVFRATYYLLPLAVALVGLLTSELWTGRAGVARAGVVMGRATEQITPAVLAALTFGAGGLLLFSSATPAAPGRLALLDRVVPLGVIEASHFLGSVTGAVLLILSQAIARRLDAAYYLVCIAIAAGVATSLLKGVDYEEAVLLSLILLVLWRARSAFDRRAALFARFSPTWVAAIVASLGASIWLGLFAFQHVDYSGDLWWQFELRGEASRFLRASVGVSVALLLFGVSRLVGIAPHEAPLPTDQDLDDAAPVIDGQEETLPFLVYLRDKAILFDDARSAFVMYGVQGRTWVALGDPVGPDSARAGLVRAFLERCDDFGGVPVFYQIGKAHLHRYADFGLTFVKLGEEALVDLTTFTLDGSRASGHRQAIRRLERDGRTFRVIPRQDAPVVMEELHRVSDEWLKGKAAAEKGFSLGFFDEAYLAHFPVAVIEHEGRIEAFATIWPGPNRVELSLDLMRYGDEAPKGAMEALFVHLLLWGRDHGYRRFSLGMAPLSGFEDSSVASLWSRFGSFLYEHGESIYNFRGLRAYKEKFDPAWEPRYLAYPGRLRLPRIMADVSALVAGGYRQIFRR